MKNRKMWRLAADELIVIAGVLLDALAFKLFFIPNNIAPGGISGVATLIHAKIPQWPVGVMIIAINIPLFLLGLRLKGFRFMIRTLVNTVLLSLIIDYLPLPGALVESLGQDPILAVVYGGLLLGVGLGLVFRGNATTGGTDVIAAVLHHYFPRLRIAWALFAVDFLVVAAAGIVLEPRLALYALAVIFISSRVADFIQVGLDVSKAFFVISKKADAISQRILSEMERGVTSLDGRGMYSGDNQSVLLCIISRSEVSVFKRIVREEDPAAFVVMSDVREVLGEGFAAEDAK